MTRRVLHATRAGIVACVVMVAGRGAGAAGRSAPTPTVEIVSVRVLDDVPLPGAGRAGFRLGGLSDLCRGAGADSLWTLTDRGPNGTVAAGRSRSRRRTLALPDFAPLLVELSLEGQDGRLGILRTIGLQDPAGDPVSGLPPGGANDRHLVDPATGTPLPWDARGLDPEGLVRLGDGRFWIAEEYGPSLIEVSSTGRILARFVPRGHAIPGAPAEVHDVLPAAHAGRRDNRGYECLAGAPDESRLFCLMQSPVGDGDDDAATAGNVRMLVFDPIARRPVAEHVYRLGPPGDRGSRRAADGKVSALACVTADRLLVVEQADHESRIYEIGIGDATNLLDRAADRDGATPVDGIADLEAAGIRPVRKTLVADLAPLAARFQRDVEPRGDGRRPRTLADLKFEGLAVLTDGRIALINDNDFDVVADGSAAATPPRRHTCLWILDVPGWPRPE